MPRQRTRDERVERLRSTVAGEKQNKKMRSQPTMANPASNLLLGVALHAAARHGKGLPLSDLEQRMLDTLRVVALDDDEITEYGQIYTEAKTKSVSGASGNVFPSTISEIHEDVSYTNEDFLKYVSKTLPEFDALPGNSIVDISKLDEKENNENPGDGKAVLESNFGSRVTIFTGPESETDTQGVATANAPYSCKLWLDRFHCIKASGDGMFNGNDEIYWGLGSGADTRAQEEKLTGEFGDVWTGAVRDFPPDTFLFAGDVQMNIVGHISCWEADESPGGFYDKLREFLHNVSTLAVQAAVDTGWDASYLIDPEGAATQKAMMAMIACVAEFLSWVLGELRNDDDFVGEHTIAITRDGLKALFKASENEIPIVFDGEHGTQELFLKALPFNGPAGVIGCATFDGTSWVGAAAPPGHSIHGPSLADHRGDLVSVIRDSDNMVKWSIYNPAKATWSSARGITGYSFTRGRPAVATHNNLIYCAYHGRSRELGCRYAGGNLNNEWTSCSLKSPPTTRSGPAIASFNEMLVMVVRKTDNILAWSESSDGNFSSWTDFPWGAKTFGSPALCVYGGELYCCFRAEGNTLCICKRSNNTWTSLTLIQSSGASAGPTLAVYQNMLWCTQRGNSIVRVWSMGHDNNNWVNHHNLTNRYPIGEQGLCAWDNKLWCTYGNLGS